MLGPFISQLSDGLDVCELISRVKYLVIEYRYQLFVGCDGKRTCVQHRLRNSKGRSLVPIS